MAEPRPRIKLRLSASDKLVESLCWSGLLGLWLAAFLLYNQLPGIIPTHFNAAGQVDGIGSKKSLWLLAFIPSVLVTGLGFLNRIPHHFNYLVEITPANAAKNYRMATRLLRFIKLFVVLLFASVLAVVAHAAEQHGVVGNTNRAVPLIIGIAFLLPVLVLVYAIRQSQK